MRERTATRPARGVRWVVAAAVVAELALLGWWATTGPALVAALGQLVVLLVAVLVVVVVRHLAHRRRFEADIARGAVQRERVLIAEDLHDALGHELALVAIRAGALQVHSTGETARQAADLRHQVDQAVLHLRETVLFLHGDQLREQPGPPTADVAALVARAGAAGADVDLAGELPPDAPAPVRATALRVVQEGLTNAAKHAPGSAIRVAVVARTDGVEVVVTTLGAPLHDPGRWSGLAALRRRVEAVGGSLTAGPDPDGHVLRAVVPLGAARQATPAATADRPRRPVVSTVRWAALPAAVVLVATAAFYSWASTGATMEQADVDALRPGEPVQQAAEHLPDRQAPVRLLRAEPAPAGSRCAYYTDGNVPLAMATFEVCDDGVRLTRVTDLRERSPW